MKLTDAEKISLLMLSEIHSALNLGEDAIDSELIKKALTSDNTWAISSELGHYLALEERQYPNSVSEVVNVLDMWDFIEEAFEELNEEQKVELKSKAEPFGKQVKFRGFDGNNETEFLNITDFHVNQLGNFQRFSGRDLNSHVPSMPRYMKMYKIFESWRDNYPDRPLNVEELAQLLTAR